MNKWVTKARKTNTDANKWYYLRLLNMAIKPIFSKKIPISQVFWNYFNGYYAKWGMKGHDWVDFASPVWTPVKAGIEWIATVPPFMAWWYGNYVKIRKTKPDWFTELLFAHLDKVLVKNGQKVTPDTIIANTGNTWGSTWPHLHFSMRLYDLKWNVINPDNWYKWMVDPMPYFEK